MIKIRATAAILLLLFLAGCSKTPYTPLSDNAVILAFGDSLTAGNGTTKAFSYPSILSKLSGKTVINAGIPGETTTQGLKRLPSILKKHNPQFVILLEGGNDFLRNHKPAATERNLSEMIRQIQAQNIQLLLVGVPAKSLFSDSHTLYQQLAEKHDVVFEDELIADLLRSPSMKSDAIHFNKAGYQKMAESIYELLKDKGAL